MEVKPYFSDVRTSTLEVHIAGTERTPIPTARALRMSAEGLAEPQPQRTRTVMIPSNCAWRPPLSMRSSKESSRFFSVRAVAPQNLIDKKSCERERCTMRMGAAAQCCRRGAVVGLYGQYAVHLLARARPDSFVLMCSRGDGSQQKYCYQRCLKKIYRRKLVRQQCV